MGPTPRRLFLECNQMSNLNWYRCWSLHKLKCSTWQQCLALMTSCPYPGPIWVGAETNSHQESPVFMGQPVPPHNSVRLDDLQHEQTIWEVCLPSFPAGGSVNCHPGISHLPLWQSVVNGWGWGMGGRVWWWFFVAEKPGWIRSDARAQWGCHLTTERHC